MWIVSKTFNDESKQARKHLPLPVVELPAVAKSGQCCVGENAWKQVVVAVGETISSSPHMQSPSQIDLNGGTGVKSGDSLHVLQAKR